MSVRDPSHYFRIESRELVASLEARLVADGADPGAIGELFRLAHTLKGSARVVGQGTIADLAHAMEDVLAHHRDAGTAMSPQEVGELLRIVDVIRDAILAPAAELPRPASGDGVPGATLEVLRIDLAEMDSLTAGVLQAQGHAELIRTRVAAVAEIRRGIEGWIDRAFEDRRAGLDARARASLDDLAASLADHQRQLSSLADSVELELRQIAQRAAVLRLVDASSVFPELERAVFDAARSTGRAARFVGRGGDVKLDAHVLSPMRAALLHLVRNAVAHGVEDADARVAAGKAMTGTVEVSVERRGGRVAFVVRDDGRGVDHDAVRRAARSRGLEHAGEAGEASAEELIFRPGVSTASEVSELAGRGVGLDVVRSLVHRSKGDVTFESIPGVGTRFELVVPVSLSAIRVLTVFAGGRPVLLPLDAIEATCAIGEGDVAWGASGRTLVHGGRTLPFRSLAAILDPGATERAPRVAVVLRAAGSAVAIGVDALRGSRDVLVRKLPGVAAASPFVAGAAFDTHGDPELVIDPALLAELPDAAARSPRARAPRRRPVLVIDDSLTTRMMEQSILEAAGYDVEVASSAEEGLAMARGGRFGLFVVDVEMPGMNGYEFTREVRASAELRDVPVIMVTSLASDESRRLGREAGISAYIVKGEFDQGGFLTKVAELLS